MSSFQVTVIISTFYLKVLTNYLISTFLSNNYDFSLNYEIILTFYYSGHNFYFLSQFNYAIISTFYLIIMI